MGARSALLAFTDGDLPSVLRDAAESGAAEAEALVRAVHPAREVRPAAGITLLDGVNPPPGVTYAAVFPGASILSDTRFRIDLPSALPEHWRTAVPSRRVFLHGMDSTVDWLGFAVWEDGVIVRSVSVSPGDGVRENIGEPFNFERSFWAGRRPVDVTPAYPLPFHPLELGEEILRALFGFVIEGRRGADDIDADAVPLHGFQVTDPAGADQAARDAAFEHFKQNAAAAAAALPVGTGRDDAGD